MKKAVGNQNSSLILVEPYPTKDDDSLAKSLFVRQVIISIAKNIAKSASVNRAGTKFKDRGIKRKTN